MSLPTLNQWWDNPQLQQMLGATGQRFGSGLVQGLAPNFVANQTLRGLVQEDPSIMEKIGNLGEDERSALAKAIGFTGGKNPFGGLPEGLERQKNKLAIDKAQTDAAIRALGLQLDPEGVISQQTGARTKDAKAQAAAKIALDQAKVDNIPVDKVLLEAEATLKQLQAEKETAAITNLKALRAKYPEVNMDALVDGLVSGKPISQGLLQLVTTDPELKGAFETLRSVAMDKVNFGQSMALARQNNAGSTEMTRAALLNTYNTQRDNVAQDLAKAQKEFEGLFPIKPLGGIPFLTGDATTDAARMKTFFQQQIAGQKDPEKSLYNSQRRQVIVDYIKEKLNPLLAKQRRIDEIVTKLTPETSR
jgi:hypothetical protein